jgi:hypothetical protein
MFSSAPARLRPADRLIQIKQENCDLRQHSKLSSD